MLLTINDLLTPAGVVALTGLVGACSTLVWYILRPGTPQPPPAPPESPALPKE